MESNVCLILVICSALLYLIYEGMYYMWFVLGRHAALSWLMTVLLACSAVLSIRRLIP